MQTVLVPLDESAFAESILPDTQRLHRKRIHHRIFQRQDGQDFRNGQPFLVILAIATRLLQQR